MCFLQYFYVYNCGKYRACCGRLCASDSAPLCRFGYRHVITHFGCELFEILQCACGTRCFAPIDFPYQRSIDAAARYETSYTANEHTQYITKSWLSMVAADPLSLVQRQAKECNSHLLKTFFGNEDILRSGPVFLRSLEYMVQCFNDTYAFSLRQRDEFTRDFDFRVDSVVNASEGMLSSYRNMTLEHKMLMDYRPVYRNSLIVSFEKLFG